jgi:YfiH family protein
MKLIAKPISDVDLLCLDSWEHAHGFAGGSMDFKTSTSAWSEQVSTDIRLVLLRQVHGVRIVAFEAGKGHDFGEKGLEEGDGWIARISELTQARTCLGVITADCFPVLMCDQKSDLIAALHCGWRSTIAGILPLAIEMFFERGSVDSDIQIAIGPGAQVNSYEIGEELAEKFLSAPNASADWVEQRSGKYFLNISQCLSDQATAKGVRAPNITAAEDCTICDESYFSFRRQKDLAGRQLSFIGGKFNL